jgi:uncharacterized protein involved in copper resistance
MKKLLAVIFIAGSLVACKNGNDADNKTDSVKDKMDSSTEAKKDMLDSANDANKAKMDSANNKMDSSKMKHDEKKGDKK